MDNQAKDILGNQQNYDFVLTVSFDSQHWQWNYCNLALSHRHAHVGVRDCGTSISICIQKSLGHAARAQGLP